MHVAPDSADNDQGNDTTIKEGQQPLTSAIGAGSTTHIRQQRRRAERTPPTRIPLPADRNDH
jgi:hypothetical protein